MTPLPLHAWHAQATATFTEVAGMEAVAHYGNTDAEYAALFDAAVLIDLSYRGRLSLMGADRQRFLNGQVTNDVKALAPGRGCYALLLDAKGHLETDLNLYALPDEYLLEFEPGLSPAVLQRLDRYIIADDVRIIDAAPHFGLLSVRGPRASAALQRAGLGAALPAQRWSIGATTEPSLGSLYIAHQLRFGLDAYDLYLRRTALLSAADRLAAAVRSCGGCLCGWHAIELARIEAGIPRFGVDIDPSNLPGEAGLEHAISYAKGCYIGQEIIARLRTYGHVTKALRGLQLTPDLPTLPVRGTRLVHQGKEVGYVTSVVRSPRFQAVLALGYVRREVNQVGTALAVRFAGLDWAARIVELPFRRD